MMSYQEGSYICRRGGFAEKSLIWKSPAKIPYLERTGAKKIPHLEWTQHNYMSCFEGIGSKKIY